MEELKDASIHHTAIKISNEIKNMKLYGQLYKTVQVNNNNITIQSRIKFTVSLKNIHLEIGLLTGC